MRCSCYSHSSNWILKYKSLSCFQFQSDSTTCLFIFNLCCMVTHKKTFKTKVEMLSPLFSCSDGGRAVSSRTVYKQGCLREDGAVGHAVPSRGGRTGVVVTPARHPRGKELLSRKWSRRSLDQTCRESCGSPWGGGGGEGSKPLCTLRASELEPQLSGAWAPRPLCRAESCGWGRGRKSSCVFPPLYGLHERLKTISHPRRRNMRGWCFLGWFFHILIRDFFFFF